MEKDKVLCSVSWNSDTEETFLDEIYIYKFERIAVIADFNDSDSLLRAIFIDGTKDYVVNCNELKMNKYKLACNYIQFVPNDIICYSAISVSQYFKGMSMTFDNSSEVFNEAVELCDKYSIDMEEKLLDMTFEHNYLIGFIQSLLEQPELLVLQFPYDMLSHDTYATILKECERVHKEGTTIIIASSSYDNVVMPCDRYIYIKENQIVAEYSYSELPAISKIIFFTEGDISVFNEEKLQIIQKDERQTIFLYEESDMIVLADLIRRSGCKNFNVGELTMEEKIYRNYERWGL